MKNKPAGWYRNLADHRQHGYWDGSAWAEPHHKGPSSDTPEDAPDDKADDEAVADDVDLP